MDTAPQKTLDLLVIGGGVNGAGIARDAAGRGLSTLLVERDDLAEGTSSRSGKLVHGGLRYLEYYEFRLVREALIEREVLLAAAPHIIWPMRFVLPHSPDDRPAWLVRAGLFLYDHLGGRKRLPATRRLDLSRAPEGRALKPGLTTAFEYSDCWVDDARLVVLNALDAAERGAEVLTRTRFDGAAREDGAWRVRLTDTLSGQTFERRARGLVNAAGPWVNGVLGGVASIEPSRGVRLVKGSHLVLKKFWDGDQAYLVQNHDKRVIFINPYEGDLALVGTTDIPVEGDARDQSIGDDEIDYLFAAITRWFDVTLERRDIVHAFTGVRPLYDDKAENPSAVTRDYVFDIDGARDEPPLLSVFGGKITTFRKLAEHALDRLRPWYPTMGPGWTREPPLPGGDVPQGDVERWLDTLALRYPWLPRPLAHHYARRYGTRLHALIGEARTLEDLGRHFGGQLYEAEARYLRAREWALTAEDVLVRRTKHHLHLGVAEREAFAEWWSDTLQREVAPPTADLTRSGTRPPRSARAAES